MACPKCGCLLLSPDRSRQHRLLCADCGHPIDAHGHQRSLGEHWRDRATIALLLAVAGCVVGLAFASDDAGRPLPASTQELRPAPTISPGD